MENSLAVERHASGSEGSTKTLVISEAELLAMPDEDYMNSAQLAFFRQRLLDMYDEITQHANVTLNRMRDLEFAADPADRATSEETHALELRVHDREYKLLGKIKSALSRIASGDYGWCEETGEPIGVRRLLARPVATLCLEAQERHEWREKYQYS